MKMSKTRMLAIMVTFVFLIVNPAVKLENSCKDLDGCGRVVFGCFPVALMIIGLIGVVYKQRHILITFIACAYIFAAYSLFEIGFIFYEEYCAGHFRRRHFKDTVHAIAWATILASPSCVYGLFYYTLAEIYKIAYELDVKVEKKSERHPKKQNFVPLKQHPVTGNAIITSKTS